jgi:hypothetical protein
MRTVKVRHYSLDGLKLVDITLRDGEVCTLEQADFEELLKSGTPAAWKMFLNNVAVSLNKKNVQIARLLLDPDTGRSIRYLDGNPLNLRKDNLIVTNGRSRFRDRKLLPHKYTGKRVKLSHVYDN